ARVGENDGMSFLKSVSNAVSNLPGRKLVEKALDKTEDAARAVAKTTKSVANAVEDGFENVVEGAETLFGNVAEKAEHVVSGASDAIEAAIKGIDSAISGREVHEPLDALPKSQVDQFQLKADFRDLQRLETIKAGGGLVPVSLADLPLDRSYRVG